MLYIRSLPAPTLRTSILTMDASDLEYVDNYTYLGVWLDCKLSFQSNIKHLQSKIKSRIDFLFRNKAFFTHAAKHTLIKLTILPILDFGDVIYKIASNTQTAFNLLSNQCHPFCHQSPIPTHHCDLYALVGWPSLHIHRQTHWLHVIYKFLLAPPYLSSLVSIAAPTCSTCSSRYFSLVIPKASSSFGRLSFQFSAANDWNKLQQSLKLETHISLTNFKHQLSEQPIYCLTSLLHLHTLYTDFSIVLLTVRMFIPCVTLCCCFCRTALLFLGQVAVVNENLFSTGLPG